MKCLMIVMSLFVCLAMLAAPAVSKWPATPATVQVAADKLAGTWYCQENQTLKGTTTRAGATIRLGLDSRCSAAANFVIAGVQAGQQTEFTGTAEMSGTWRLNGNQVEVTLGTVRIVPKGVRINGTEIRDPRVLQGFQTLIDRQAVKVRGQKRTLVILECGASLAKVDLGETTVTLTRKPR